MAVEENRTTCAFLDRHSARSFEVVGAGADMLWEVNEEICDAQESKRVQPTIETAKAEITSK